MASRRPRRRGGRRVCVLLVLSTCWSVSACDEGAMAVLQSLAGRPDFEVGYSTENGVTYLLTEGLCNLVPNDDNIHLKQVEVWVQDDGRTDPYGAYTVIQDPVKFLPYDRCTRDKWGPFVGTPVDPEFASPGARHYRIAVILAQGNNSQDPIEYYVGSRSVPLTLQ